MKKALLLFCVLVSFISFAAAQSLTLKVIRYKKRRPIFILLGFLVSILAIISFIHASLNVNLRGVITICMVTPGPPLGVSWFFEREFALDSQLLQLKFHQVEMLSAKNLTQEIEKQSLLAKQNQKLERRVAARTAELNQSLINLKSTRTQLVQFEKMASLGEPRAGIAHEIQNRLNFVNNFSDVSAELVDELQQELKNTDKEEAIAIPEDIKQNLEKIRHLGMRADVIVKGMLQDSQSSSGKKEPTDLNALADEYLRLSYHGLRSKYKNFNAELAANFDRNFTKVDIIPQNMGRLLLNLFNDVFYAVNQKSKTAEAYYKPEARVTTSSENGQSVIKAKDNGMDIPKVIKEKIMQPFSPPNRPAREQVWDYLKPMIW